MERIAVETAMENRRWVVSKVTRDEVEAVFGPGGFAPTLHVLWQTPTVGIERGEVASTSISVVYDYQGYGRSWDSRQRVCVLMDVNGYGIASHDLPLKYSTRAARALIKEIAGRNGYDVTGLSV